MPTQMAKLCRDKAVIVRVYGEKAAPSKRRKSNASKKDYSSIKVHHVVHHHHHLHVHHTLDHKPLVSPGDRKAHLLDFSRRLRAAAAAGRLEDAPPPTQRKNTPNAGAASASSANQHRRQGSNGILALRGKPSKGSAPSSQKFQNFFKSIVFAGGNKSSRKNNGPKPNPSASTTTANPMTSIINGIKMHNNKKKKKGIFAKLFASLMWRK